MQKIMKNYLRVNANRKPKMYEEIHDTIMLRANYNVCKSFYVK